jgi:uncharacterized protein YndB with AHSA1/START domain
MLTLTKDDETGLVVTRLFSATPQQLWEAHVDPVLIRQWMLGPDGWELTRCDSEGTAGGTIRFDWSNGQGDRLSLTGEIVEALPPHRMVHVERMHLPDPTPDNHVETLIDAEGDGCRLTLIMTLPDARTRDAMLDTGMAEGMEASYARLEALIAR